MSEYEPYQHVSKPQGCDHTICFAGIELWMDDLPDVLVIGGIRWVRQDVPRGRHMKTEEEVERGE